MPMNQTNSGVLYFLVSIGLISLVDTICKFYTDELNAVMLVWGYFVAITIFVAGYFGARRDVAVLQCNRPGLQIARFRFPGGFDRLLVRQPHLSPHSRCHCDRLHRAIVHYRPLGPTLRRTCELASLARRRDRPGRCPRDCPTRRGRLALVGSYDTSWRRLFRAFPTRHASAGKPGTSSRPRCSTRASAAPPGPAWPPPFSGQHRRSVKWPCSWHLARWGPAHISRCCTHSRERKRPCWPPSTTASSSGSRSWVTWCSAICPASTH